MKTEKVRLERLGALLLDLRARQMMLDERMSRSLHSLAAGALAGSIFFAIRQFWILGVMLSALADACMMLSAVSAAAIAWLFIGERRKLKFVVLHRALHAAIEDGGCIRQSVIELYETKPDVRIAVDRLGFNKLIETELKYAALASQLKGRACALKDC